MKYPDFNRILLIVPRTRKISNFLEEKTINKCQD